MATLKSLIRRNIPVALGAYHFLLAWSAAKLRGRPSRKIFVIGVTGTKGKTTTLELLNAILEEAGKKTALLSSLRVKIGERSRKNPTGNSMPGRGYIQSFLHQAVKEGCGYALIEVTSQGVVAHRHRFVDWNVGVLTNLHPEHIESHGSFENYRAAKLEFLRYVIAHGGKLFLNEDDPHFPFFRDALTNAKVETYTIQSGALSHFLPHATPVRSAAGAALPEAARFLTSDFNKSNIACAVGLAKDLGIAEATIQNTILKFKGVPGRYETVTVDGYTAVVDYAHTPESLEAVYKASKPQEQGRLLCVLGACGGGRDVWKRPEFGKIAAKYCDEVVLTEEDPYDEDPKKITEAIASGLASANYPISKIHEVPARREAIKVAVQMMEPGDVVIGTGKGSEDWIHYAGGRKERWSEREEFERALLAKKGGSKPQEENAAQEPDLELPWM